MTTNWQDEVLKTALVYETTTYRFPVVAIPVVILYRPVYYNNDGVSMILSTVIASVSIHKVKKRLVLF